MPREIVETEDVKPDVTCLNLSESHSSNSKIHLNVKSRQIKEATLENNVVSESGVRRSTRVRRKKRFHDEVDDPGETEVNSTCVESSHGRKPTTKPAVSPKLGRETLHLHSPCSPRTQRQARRRDKDNGSDDPKSPTVVSVHHGSINDDTRKDGEELCSISKIKIEHDEDENMENEDTSLIHELANDGQEESIASKIQTLKVQVYKKKESQNKVALDQDDYNSGGVILCPYCDFKGNLPFAVVKHILALHSTRVRQGNHYKKYQCIYCEKFFRGLETLRKHLAVAHRDQPDNNKGILDPGKPHLCPNQGCGHAFELETRLIRHLRFCYFKPAKSDSEKADREGKVSSRRTIISRKRPNKHALSSENHKHSVVSKCHEECQKMALEKVPFDCSQCGKTFRHHSALVYHEALTHSKKSLRLQCEHCDAGEFPSYWRLYRHLKLKHDISIGEGVCQMCGKEFLSPGYVQIHIETVHLKLRRFTCELCKKSFTHRSVLHTHYADVHSDHPLFGIHLVRKKCSTCGKEFKSSGGLRVHRKRHELENSPDMLKAFKCDTCGKTFYTRGHLMNHAVTHTGNRQFLCPLCHKGFGTQATLYNHLYRYKAHGNLPKIKGYGSQVQHQQLAQMNMLNVILDDSEPAKQPQKANKIREAIPEEIKSTDLTNSAESVKEEQSGCNPQKIKIKISEEGIGQIISDQTGSACPDTLPKSLNNDLADTPNIMATSTAIGSGIANIIQAAGNIYEMPTEGSNTNEIQAEGEGETNTRISSPMKANEEVAGDMHTETNQSRVSVTDTDCQKEESPSLELSGVNIGSEVMCDGDDVVPEYSQTEYATEYHVMEEYATSETVVTDEVIQPGPETMEIADDGETTIVVVPASEFNQEETLQIQLSGFDELPGNTIILEFPSRDNM